jgi:DNA repair exonuclease SbcCD nuclease subunit
MATLREIEPKSAGQITSIKKDENSAKFLHASDIHLGSQQYRNPTRSDDFIRAFQEILSLALEHRVDFILLGGDVFTSLEMLPGKLNKIVNILKEFKDVTEDKIPIIAIEGNHDIRRFSRGVRFERRGQSWLKLLANLKFIILLDANLEAPQDQVFRLYNSNTRTGGKIKIKNVMVYGTQYNGEKPYKALSIIRKAIKKKDGVFNVLIQHFGIEGYMENVPGADLAFIQTLRHKVDYLALGHFHKQYIIDNWIFNPGSSEAACSIDFSFKRGVFLVEITGKEKYVKKNCSIPLKNRNYIWKTIHFPTHFRKKQVMHDYLFQKLNVLLNFLDPKLDPSELKMPIFYLILKGRKPFKSCKIKTTELSALIREKYPVVDTRIYLKFEDQIETMDRYL